MKENRKINRPNVEKLAAFINKQPNPQEFAIALLVIASLKPRTQSSADRHKESQVIVR